MKAREDEIDFGAPVDEIARRLPPLMKIEHAEKMGVGCARTVRQMCMDGKIPSVKVDGVWLINRDRFLRLFGLVS